VQGNVPPARDIVVVQARLGHALRRGGAGRAAAGNPTGAGAAARYLARAGTGGEAEGQTPFPSPNGYIAGADHHPIFNSFGGYLGLQWTR
jgi:hypothetical protein